MNRTWDLPELYLAGNIESAVACPTLAPAIANYAIRGALSPNSGAAADPERFPSFDETRDFLGVQISDRFEADPSSLINVYEDDVRSALDQRVDIFNLLTTGDVAEPFAVDNDQPLEANRERFTMALADIMMQPDQRKQLLANADAYVRAKSERINQAIRTTSLEYDVIIKGGGIHTANVVATLQECVPDIRMLVINDGSSTDLDDQPRLGGQFRYYGDIPVFDLNSGTGQAEDIGGLYGLPKNGGNLNSFGLHSPLQLPDFVGTDQPTNVDPGEAAALVIALSGADVAFGEVVREEKYDGKNRVALIDERRLSLYPFITPEPVIEATGVGRPSDGSDGYSAIMAIDRVWREFGSHRPGTPHPLEQFAGKVLLGGGCGDSMKALFKLVFGQGPKEAYRGWSANRGRPGQAYWVAPEFAELGTTKLAIKSGVRPIYASLARFFPEVEGGRGRIIPIAGRLDFRPITGEPRVLPPEGGVLSLPPADAIFRGFGTRRDGTTFFDNDRDKLVRYGQYETDLFGSRFALRSSGRPYDSKGESMGVGAIQPLEVNNDVGIPANTISIWSRAPAATLVPYWVAGRVRGRRQGVAVGA